MMECNCTVWIKVDSKELQVSDSATSPAVQGIESPCMLQAKCWLAGGQELHCCKWQAAKLFSQIEAIFAVSQELDFVSKS